MSPDFNFDMQICEVMSYRQSALEAIINGNAQIDSTNGTVRFERVDMLDEHALRRAVKIVQAINPILSTCINIRGGRPWIVAQEDIEPEVIFLNLSSHLNDQKYIQKSISSYIWKQFDFQNGPLFRIFAIILPGDIVYIGIGVHHFIVDGSVDYLMRDLLVVYTGGPKEECLSLNALPYLSYLDIMNKWFESPNGKLARAQYLGRLGEIPRLSIASQLDGTSGAREHFSFPPDDVDRIKDCAQALRTTPYLLFLAAQTIMLYPHSDQARVCIKAVTAGRETPALKHVIGNMADRMYVVVDLSGDPTFAEIVRRCHRAMTESWKLSFVRFDIVQADLRRAGLPVAAPVFNFRAGGSNRTNAFNIPSAPAFSKPEEDSGPYWLEMLEDSTGIACNVRYSKSKLHNFVPNFCHILKCGISNHDIKLNEFDNAFG